MLLAQQCLPPSWVARQEQQDTDYGIDLEVELASAQVTGRLFKAQVKGHASIRWTAAGSFSQAVRPETIAYWRALPLPVVLLIVDLQLKTTHWAPGVAPSDVTSIAVSRSSMLPKDAPSLAAYVTDWLDDRSNRSVIYSLPLLEAMWQKLEPDTLYDEDMEIDEEHAAMLPYVYRQVGMARRALGLSASMLPWAMWPARARLVFPNARGITWGIHDEMLDYMRPLVQELLTQGRAYLDAEAPSAENAPALSWANDNTIRFESETEFDTASLSVWQSIDRRLAASGAKRWDMAHILSQARRPSP